MTPKRRDINHKEIVDGLRDAHYVVEDLADIGKGIPDLMVESRSGIWVLFEVKQPGGKLTKPEQEFFDRHSAPVRIVRSLDDALAWMEYYDGYKLEAQ